MSDTSLGNGEYITKALHYSFANLDNRTLKKRCSLGLRHVKGLIALVCVTVPSFSVGEEESSKPDEKASRTVEEVVVTASRRAQDVQDIASGIKVFGGEDLEKSGASQFEDYIFQIPGADFGDNGTDKKISVRGISKMAPPQANYVQVSPIGVYLNDTPIQGGGALQDLDLYDLQRIEVLKGPQGTLYGEGAQGGAVRMLLNPADPSEFYAKGEIGFGETKHADGYDRFQKAAVNIPLGESWATRLVGTNRTNKGYIDYVNLGIEGANDTSSKSARLHVDGDISDALSVSALAMHQEQRLDQLPQAQKGQGEFTNTNREPQFQDLDFSLAALTFNYDLGFATATIATSGAVSEQAALTRFPFFGVIVDVALVPVLAGIEDAGLPAVPAPPDAMEQEWFRSYYEETTFVHETRLVSNGDSWLNWVAGIFYRERIRDGFGEFSDSVAQNDPEGPYTVHYDDRQDYEQYAIFGEATATLPWNLEASLGLRKFQEDFGYTVTSCIGSYTYPAFADPTNPQRCNDEASLGSDVAGVSPKASLTWFIDDMRMIYLSAAKGDRSGGVNAQTFLYDATPFFEPDELWAYEIGAKTKWFDGLLTANISVYRNNWNDLQVPTLETVSLRSNPAVSLAVNVMKNVGRAYSEGAELELSAQPLEGLTIAFNASVAEGEIVEGSDDGQIPDGSPLPQLADTSYSALIGYTARQWPIFGFTPSLQVDTQFVDERWANLPGPYEANEPLISHQLVNARLSFVSDHWDLSVAVKNLTDERTEYGTAFFEPDTYTIGRPKSWVVRIATEW